MSRDEASSSNECLYSILGVERTCSASEIRAAYRKLAMKWHPDKCPASAVDLAKSKFQDIQDAYSVLSDDSKRFLYDSGLYNEVHDDEGMQDFMGEMAKMMSACSSKNTFGELQEMFNQMVDSYLPDDLRASSSSNTSFASSFSGSSQPLFGKQSFCIGVESCSNQSFCIGRQDHEPMAKQKVQRKPQKRRKCPYNQGAR